jgi:hypothetical protein
MHASEEGALILQLLNPPRIPPNGISFDILSALCKGIGPVAAPQVVKAL